MHANDLRVMKTWRKHSNIPKFGCFWNPWKNVKWSPFRVTLVNPLSRKVEVDPLQSVHKPNINPTKDGDHSSTQSIIPRKSPSVLIKTRKQNLQHSINLCSNAVKNYDRNYDIPATPLWPPMKASHFCHNTSANKTNKYYCFLRRIARTRRLQMSVFSGIFSLMNWCCNQQRSSWFELQGTSTTRGRKYRK